MVQALLAWKPKTSTLPGRLEELYILMYERAIVGENDVLLVQVGGPACPRRHTACPRATPTRPLPGVPQAWISDLIRLGYSFPRL